MPAFDLQQQVSCIAVAIIMLRLKHFWAAHRNAILAGTMKPYPC